MKHCWHAFMDDWMRGFAAVCLFSHALYSLQGLNHSWKRRKRCRESVQIVGLDLRFDEQFARAVNDVPAPHISTKSTTQSWHDDA